MSEFGSIRVIILVYTGRNDLIQIVSSQNNKMILFYFHGSVKHFNIVNACSVVDLIMHLSMLSPRVGGRADSGEFDILMAARVKFPTPRHLNVNFPPLG